MRLPSPSRCAPALLVLALLGASGPAWAEAAIPSQQAPLEAGRPEHSFLIPAGEVLAQEALLLGLNRGSGASFAQIDGASIRSNLRLGFAFDDDNYPTNSFLHPYQGALYFTAARSSGLSFWEAAPYSAAGSLIWELFMETQRPSVNDMIMTSAGGALLGEALYRMARLTLGPGSPGWGRRLGALLIDPLGGANELAFAGRYTAGEPSPGPFLGRLELGPRLSALGTGRLTPVPASARVAVEISSGAPDQSAFRRPLDHFDFELELTANSLALDLADVRGWTWMVLLRGALAGADLQLGQARGLAGLFGLFDFTGPNWTRTADVGAGPGLVLAGLPAPGLRLEGTAVLAAAFGTGGGQVPRVDERDYHYALLARGVLDLRLQAGPLELRAGAHQSLAPLVLDGEPEGFTLLRLSSTLHLPGPHALALEGDFTRRHLRGQPLQRWASAGLSYALCF